MHGHLAKMTPAEDLIDTAEYLLFPRDCLLWITPRSGWAPSDLGRCALAIKFYQSRPSLRFRAVVEGWDLDRITMEVNV